MKILGLGADLFDADGQTDVTHLIVAFRSFDKRQVTYYVHRF